MASSHRKPRSAGSRIAGIWTPAADDGDRSPGEVEKKIDDLYRRAESATETYNAAKQRKRADSLLGDVARRAQRLNSVRERLSSFTAAQYRAEATAPDASTFLLPDTPPDYFEQAQLMSRLTSRQKNAVRHESTESLQTPDGTRSDLRTAKATVQKKLSTARELLSQPTGPKQRAETAKATPSDSSYATKAAKAVAFARAQVGKPYVWGANGPSGFDCSGLMQWSYRQAGIGLPRTSQEQRYAGRHVSLSQAQPGDLITYRSDASHVAMYVGNGQVIHAPYPGAPVRYDPVGMMPISSVTRV